MHRKKSEVCIANVGVDCKGATDSQRQRVKSRKGEQKKEGEREGKRTDLTGLWVFSRK